jgi:putative membrane protein
MSLLASGSILFEPNPGENFPLIAATAIGVMYFLGGRSFRRACRLGTIAPERIRAERRRTTWFTLGVVSLVLALQEPLDKWADQLFWAHMVQHMVLIVVAAPLIVLGAPWMRVFRALPLNWRRRLALWALRGRTGAPLRGIARGVANPWVCWWLLAIDLVVWHIPGAYDLTLRSEAVHYCEHATFLIFALFVWGHLIDSAPFHCTLSEPGRIALAFSQMVVMWVLGLLLAFAQQPWYSVYADLRHRPGGISALTDQHLGGGIMWVPASIPYSIAIIVWIYRWVSEAWNEGPQSQVPAVLAPPPGPQPTPPSHMSQPTRPYSPSPSPSPETPVLSGVGATQSYALSDSQDAPRRPLSPARRPT